MILLVLLEEGRRVQSNRDLSLAFTTYFHKLECVLAALKLLIKNMPVVLIILLVLSLKFMLDFDVRIFTVHPQDSVILIDPHCYSIELFLGMQLQQVRIQQVPFSLLLHKLQ